MGRPTLYLPEYCDAVIEAAKEGLSLTAWAGSIGTSRETVNQWGKAHSEFAEAVAASKAVRVLAWERRLGKVGDAARGSTGPGVATAIIFALKNLGPEDWADKQSVSLSGPNGGALEHIHRIERVIVDPPGQNTAIADATGVPAIAGAGPV